MRKALSLISRPGVRLAAAGITLLAAGSVPAAAATFDLNGDGRSDIVIRNTATGANRVIFMNGTQVTSDAPLPPLTDRDYVMAALADFNLDNRADLLWRHQSSGERFYWAMNGANVSGTVALGQNVDTDWRIAGTGSLGGDARPDVVWRHEATGEHILWVMTASGPSARDPAGRDRPGLAHRRHRERERRRLRGHLLAPPGRTEPRCGSWATARSSSRSTMTPRDPLWQFVGVGDFDLNGAADILWRHPLSGKGIIWLMNGTAILDRSDELFITHGGEWQPEMIADYNGDNKSDILWRHQVTGQMQVWLMDGKVRIASGSIPSPGPGFTLAGKPQPPASATVFLATLTPEGAANTPASGSSTIILAPDGLSARITLNFTNLTTMQTAAHVHGPADPGTSAPALYSVPMGSFNDVSWIFEATGGLTVADQVDALKTGRLYINVHSTNYPNGEIRGQYRITAAGGHRASHPQPAAARTADRRARRTASCSRRRWGRRRPWCSRSSRSATTRSWSSSSRSPLRTTRRSWTRRPPPTTASGWAPCARSSTSTRCRDRTSCASAWRGRSARCSSRRPTTSRTDGAWRATRTSSCATRSATSAACCTR